MTYTHSYYPPPCARTHTRNINISRFPFLLPPSLSHTHLFLALSQARTHRDTKVVKAMTEVQKTTTTKQTNKKTPKNKQNKNTNHKKTNAVKGRTALKVLKP